MNNDPKLSVISLRDGRPSLNDIPGRLRLLADEIERGEYPECETCLIVLNKNGWPNVLQFGNADGENHPIILLQLALTWITNRIMVRKS